MGLIFQPGNAGYTCKQCKRRDKCHYLCPPIAWMIKQVEIEPGKEHPVDPNVIGQTRSYPQADGNAGTTVSILKFYFVYRMDPKEIADALYISRRYVNKVIKEGKEKLKQIIEKSVPT